MPRSAIRAVMRSHVPLAVPTIDSRDPKVDHSQPDPNAWQPYLLARFEENLGKPPVNPATTALESVFDAYAAQDAAAFNQAVAGYAASLATQPPAQTSTWKVAFESWFNYWGPFSNCQWLYFGAFCLAALAWLGWRRPLNRAAFWLIFVVFLAHSLADVSRVLISGRPPVINLYSTAIFIGWGAVCAGLVLEAIYHMGYGNIVASVAGFATLLIADKLTLLLEPASGGDTIGVMQAVLDTQFWLATHVTTENLGYCATYVAGLLGLIYVVRGLLTPSLAAVAIAGVPGLAGFFSKDEILAKTFISGHLWLWVVGTVTSFLTAVYMFRLVFMAFHGKRHVQAADPAPGQDHARDHATPHHL
jgi:hypothetical protein